MLCVRTSASVGLLNGSHTLRLQSCIWVRHQSGMWIWFTQRYMMLYVRTAADRSGPVWHLVIIDYPATRCTYSLRSYMLHVRTSSNVSVVLNGSRTPVLHSGMTPLWPLDMVYAALRAVRTHFCERQLQSCIQVRHLVQSGMWIWFMQRYMMLYVRTAADLVQSGIQSTYYSLRSYMLYVWLLHAARTYALLTTSC